MKITVTDGDVLRQETPLLVLGAWEDESLPQPVAGLLEEGNWLGKPKQSLLLYPREALPARRLLLIGLGKRANASGERLSESAALAAQRARDLKVEQYALAVPAAEAGCMHQRPGACGGQPAGLVPFSTLSLD